MTTHRHGRFGWIFETDPTVPIEFLFCCTAIDRNSRRAVLGIVTSLRSAIGTRRDAANCVRDYGKMASCL